MAELPTHFTLRLLQLPTRHALDATHRVSHAQHRLLTVVGLHRDHDLEHVAGWGECSALNKIGYTNESAEGAFELLRSGTQFDRTQFPMAAAALEMALLDASLKQAGESLADRVGTAGMSAPAGAVVGLGPIPGMLDQVEELAQAGYTRVKCKVAPERLSLPVAAIRNSFPDIELHVDANGSLRVDDIPTLLHLRDAGVRSIEQPFAVGDHHAAARLVAESDIAVMADEAVQNPGDVEELAFDKAATGVIVKPSKLGGIQAALELLDQVQVCGMQASIGGMLESGLGRHVLAALAPLDIFTLTGDLSPAKRWLADDPFPDISLRRGRITAPKRAGIAGEPSAAKLERYTVRTATVTASDLVKSLP